MKQVRKSLRVAVGVITVGALLTGCADDSVFDLATKVVDEAGTSVPEKGTIEMSMSMSGVPARFGWTESDVQEFVDFAYIACKRVEDGDWRIIERQINSQWGEDSAGPIYELLSLACPDIMTENT